MSLSELRKLVMDREACHAVIHGVVKSPTRLSDWTDMESKKMVMMNLFAGQQWSCRYREQTFEDSGGRIGRDELREKHWNIYITKFPVGICCMTEEPKPGTLKQTKGVGWGGRREGSSRGWAYVYLWLIHVDIWQKPTQHCKAIVLLLKINKRAKNPKGTFCPTQ